MNDHYQPPDEIAFLERVMRFQDGLLNADEMAALEREMMAAPEKRRLFVEAQVRSMSIHERLRQEAYRPMQQRPRIVWFSWLQRRPLTTAADEPQIAMPMNHAPARRTMMRPWAWPMTASLVAAAIIGSIVALTASLYFQQPGAERRIAKITGLSGALQWTGNDGRVVRDLNIGTGLSGGTIEGMAPGSWFELQFNDGSTVAIFGNSMLTFSDDGQKKLHLKEGNVSSNVKPQPAGRPMLIHTQSAVLEVLGTQFEVQVGLAATMLNVSKGTVRLKRLSDGATVDVTAKHRVIAAADRELSPVPIPAAVNRWRSQLELGPGGQLGKWSPKTGELGARLGTVPYTTRSGKTIYSIGFGVSCGDRPPVTLQPGSRFRVRGRIASSHPVYFGVTVRHADDGFAGKFQTIRPAAEFPGGQNFEVVLDLQDFRLDPSLNQMKDKLPGSPFHLVLDSMWCHTLYQQAGLEVTEVELIPPVEEK